MIETKIKQIVVGLSLAAIVGACDKLISDDYSRYGRATPGAYSSLLTQDTKCSGSMPEQVTSVVGRYGQVTPVTYSRLPTQDTKYSGSMPKQVTSVVDEGPAARSITSVNVPRECAQVTDFRVTTIPLVRGSFGTNTSYSTFVTIECLDKQGYRMSCTDKGDCYQLKQKK